MSVKGSPRLIRPSRPEMHGSAPGCRPGSTHLGARLQPNLCISCLSQSVHSDGQGAFGRQDARDLALELGRGLPDERRMVDQAVLGRLVLCLEGPAQQAASSQSHNRCACIPGRVWNLISKHCSCRCKLRMHRPPCRPAQQMSCRECSTTWQHVGPWLGHLCSGGSHRWMRQLEASGQGCLS